jgi:hypothetical protein
MERQGGSGDIEPIRDGTRRQAGRPLTHEQPEDGEPRLLCESGQGIDGLCRFHNSKNMKSNFERQAEMQTLQPPAAAAGRAQLLKLYVHLPLATLSH